MVATVPNWSVVIPCWHPEPEWLDQAIASAVGTGCAERNVVLVADGPDDGLLDAVCTRYEGLRVLRHEETRGVAAARTTGLEAVQTPFVTFLDQDDYFTHWMPKALVVARTGDGEVAVVGNIATIDVTTGTVRTSNVWPRREQVWSTAVLDLMLENAQVARWVIPTDVARGCAFAEGVGIGDDSAFLAEVAARTTIVIVPDSVVIYRQHPRQTSVQPERTVTKEHQVRLEGVLEAAAGRRFSDQAVRRRLAARRHYWAAARLRREDGAMPALGHVIMAALRDPTTLRSPVGRRALGVAAGSIIKTMVRP